MVRLGNLSSGRTKSRVLATREGITTRWDPLPTARCVLALPHVPDELARSLFADGRDASRVIAPGPGGG